MKRIQADAILLFVALVWGLAFAAQRVAAPAVGVWWFNGARFFLAGLALLPLVIWKRLRLPHKKLPLILVTSAVLAAASGLQQAGLQFTTAANAGFITSLYVVLVPILGLILFRRKTRRSAWLAALIAVMGALLLSAGGRGIQLLTGDALEFIGAILWAMHLLLVDRVVKEVDVLAFAFIQYLVVGVAQAGLGLIFEPAALPLLREVWWAVVYTGVVSVGIGYTLQAVAQKSAPPVDAAILLSMEAVFAALGGFFLLGETLLPPQVLGCGLILAAVIAAQAPVYSGVLTQDS